MIVWAVRVLVIGEDQSYSTYTVYVSVAPADWPRIHPPPPEVHIRFTSLHLKWRTRLDLA